MSSPELDAWVLATAPRAVAYARSLLRNHHEAEDIVQDCYSRLLAKRDVYDLPRDGLKLLLTAISNACINLKTRRRTFFRLVRTDAETGQDEAEDPADRTALAPDVLAEHREFAEMIAEGLQKLPTQQRAAIQLKSMGHTQHEIAEILNITVTNVGVLIFRARQTLAKSLSPYLGGEALK